MEYGELKYYSNNMNKNNDDENTYERLKYSNEKKIVSNDDEEELNIEGKKENKKFSKI
jgi:hypothetical protein